MVFGGEGKGKTSAALGTVLRLVCTGGKAAWISWYKSDEWSISEKEAEKLLPNLRMYWFGKGFYFRDQDTGNRKRVGKANVYDNAEKREHEVEARMALEKVKDVLEKDEAELVVMDEVLNAVADGLIDLIDLIDLISNRGRTHLVLTGRKIPKEIVQIADMVSEIKKIKHPFDKGQLAVKGIDF